MCLTYIPYLLKHFLEKLRLLSPSWEQAASAFNPVTAPICKAVTSPLPHSDGGSRIPAAAGQPLIFLMHSE